MSKETGVIKVSMTADKKKIILRIQNRSVMAMAPLLKDVDEYIYNGASMICLNNGSIKCIILCGSKQDEERLSVLDKESYACVCFVKEQMRLWFEVRQQVVPNGFFEYVENTDEMDEGTQMGDESESNYRKVLINTFAMSGDYIIILTDAPASSIEKWCKNYNKEQEEGLNTYFDSLKIDYTVKVLADSELGFERDDIDIIGYCEVYDVSDYACEEVLAEEEEPLCTYDEIFNRVKEIYGTDDVELNSLFFDFKVSASKEVLLSAYRDLQCTINGDVVVHLNHVVIKTTRDGSRYVYGVQDVSSELQTSFIDYAVKEDFLGLHEHYVGNMKNFLESFNGREYETGWCRIDVKNKDDEGFIEGELLDFIW